jgi:DNA-binding HxlR family transcriptional regulator
MSSGYASKGSVAQADRAAPASAGEVLRLLSAGAPGEILLALSEGPMQTKVLTHRVSGYTPRTIYRYLPKLAELGLLQRDDEPGGPARVVHTLDERGDELAALIDRFATASMTRLPGGQIDAREWTALGLLADLWEAGVIEALSRGPTSPTELTRSLGALSYHQLNRRASRFEVTGYFCESRQSPRQRRCYALTRKARRAMGLIAGIGRWRQRHSETGEAGLTPSEAATALRVALPLATMKRHARTSTGLCITGSSLTGNKEVWVETDDDGSVRCREAERSRPDAWAVANAEEWLAMLLDGDGGPVVGGDRRIVEDCLGAVHREIWSPA